LLVHLPSITLDERTFNQRYAGFPGYFRPARRERSSASDAPRSALLCDDACFYADKWRMFGLLVFVWIFCLCAAIVSTFRRKGAKKYWIAVGVVFVLMYVTLPKSPESGQTNVAESSSNSQQTPERTKAPTEKPTPGPTVESYSHQRRREKQAFLSGVDESISGAMIAGNGFKYVGKNVDIHCTVANIPDRNAFNANCGDEENIALVVVEYDATGLSTGQAVRVIGTVEEPIKGTNGMGGAMQFPTVKAEFME
jgi:hypothetical protein